MKQTFIRVAVMCSLLAPGAALAANGFATTAVNMRSGPSTEYPAVEVIPAGAPVNIHGCLSEVPWCDVSFAGGRGWVAGEYVRTSYKGRDIYVGPSHYRSLGIPVVTFSVDDYWGRYYRKRDFYSRRDHWRARRFPGVVVRPGHGPAVVIPGRRPDVVVPVRPGVRPPPPVRPGARPHRDNSRRPF